MNETTNKTESTQIAANVRISAGGTIEITVEEFARLKDIETRFAIVKEAMMNAEYVSLHMQLILGIKNEYEKLHKEIKTDLFPDALKK